MTNGLASISTGSIAAFREFDGGDLVALLGIVLGIVCEWAGRRVHPKIGSTLFIWFATLGLGFLFSARTEPDGLTISVDSLLLALPCAIWAVFGWVESPRRERIEQEMVRNSSGVFFGWSLVFGIVAYMLLMQSVVSATWIRIVDAHDSSELLRWRGLAAVGLLVVATVSWGLRERAPQMPVMLLALVATAVWWTSLMIPPLAGANQQAAFSGLGFRPRWWDWSFHLQFGLAALLAIAAYLQDSLYRSRRDRAWPERLEDLLQPYSRWPAYIQIEAVIAAAILVLGVYQIVRQGAASRALATASLTASMLAGTTCLFMNYRRWSGNTASLGLALLSLAVVNVFIGVAAWWSNSQDWNDYSRRMPRLFTGVLYGLALMSVLWRWLADVWQQQLLDGEPWTTSGRLIPFAKRVSFFLAALAMLVAFRMALWPETTPVADDDNTMGRVVCGAAAIGLLGLLSARRARREDRPVAAGLALTFATALLVFLFVRIPPSPVRGWLIQHDAVVYAAMALPLLLAAEAAPKSRWQAFAIPLWFVAVLILPFWSLAQLLRPSSAEEWVRPLTFAILGAIYSFAATREHRRAFLVLGAAMLIASVASLYQAYGTATPGRRMGSANQAGMLSQIHLHQPVQRPEGRGRSSPLEADGGNMFSTRTYR